MRAGSFLGAAHGFTLLSPATAVSLRNLGTSLGLVKRADPRYGYVAFVNCWTSGSSGGARSELDFYVETPTNFGNAEPDARVVTSNGSNYEWEDKPDQFRYGAQTNLKFKFLLDSGAKAASDGDLVGSASAGSATYDVFKNKPGKDLYNDRPFGCQAFYQAVPKDSSTTTSSATTAGPTSTSTGAPDAAAATTTTGAPDPTGAPAPATESPAPGLSRGAQIGVGVGVGVGGAALLAALALALLRWLRTRHGASRGLEPGIEQSAPMMAKTGTESNSHRSTNGIDGGSHYASTQAT